MWHLLFPIIFHAINLIMIHSILVITEVGCQWQACTLSFKINPSMSQGGGFIDRSFCAVAK